MDFLENLTGTLTYDPRLEKNTYGNINCKVRGLDFDRKQLGTSASNVCQVRENSLFLMGAPSQLRTGGQGVMSALCL